MKRFIKSAIACLAAVAMVVTAVPANVNAAPKKTVVVTSQKALEKAIKQGATKITIKTKKNVAITIPSGKKLNGVSIVVNAKNASVTNKGSVKSLTIKDALSFTEKGKNNTIKVTDTQLTLKVANAAKGTEISVAKKNADVTLVVSKKAEVAAVEVAAEGVSLALDAKGSVAAVTVAENATDAKLNIDAAGVVESVTVDAKADVEVKGSTTETVKVVVNAADTVVKAETAIDTTLNADAKVDLAAGAEGSKVTTAENVTSDITNGTSEQIKVTDSKGTETSVDAGKSESKTDSKTDTSKDTSTSGGSTSGGSSSGGSTTTKGKTWVVTNAAILKATFASAAAIDAIQIDATAGAISIEESVETKAKKLEIKNGKLAVSDAAIVVTCGALNIAATATLEIGTKAAVACTSFTNAGTLSGNGKLKQGAELTYDGAEYAALSQILQEAKTYDYDSGKNFVTMGALTLDSNTKTVTLDYKASGVADKWKECAKHVYTSKDKSAWAASGSATVYNATSKAAIDYCMDSVIMNTFNRYVAALYKADTANDKAVTEICFKDSTYTWCAGKSTNGSCWYTSSEEDGTSLVSAVVADENSAIREVQFDIVGANGMKVTVTFKVTNLPNNYDQNVANYVLSATGGE